MVFPSGNDAISLISAITFSLWCSCQILPDFTSYLVSEFVASSNAQTSKSLFSMKIYKHVWLWFTTISRSNESLPISGLKPNGTKIYAKHYLVAALLLACFAISLAPIAMRVGRDSCRMGSAQNSDYKAR